MVELVDTLDLKSDAHKACGFDSRSAHQQNSLGLSKGVLLVGRSLNRTRRGSIMPGSLLRRRITRSIPASRHQQNSLGLSKSVLLVRGSRDAVY